MAFAVANVTENSTQPMLEVERKRVGTKRLGPALTDEPMVELDDFGQVPQVLVGNAAVVVGENATAGGGQPKLRGVLLCMAHRNVDMDRFAVLGDPKEQDVPTDRQHFWH